MFWYDEIEGDQELQQPGYAGQFIEMPDGSEARIEVTRSDDLTVAFHYPRIVANPILSTNMSSARATCTSRPSRRAAPRACSTCSASTPIPPPSLPSAPITSPSTSLACAWWWCATPTTGKTDEAGVSLPYIERVIYQIVPDRNTEFLLFKEGNKDAYTLRPRTSTSCWRWRIPDFTVYNGGASLGSAFVAFNQNPDTMDALVHSWFSQTEFRQAMSSVLNRDRIASQVYRGLAEPALYFFARANPYFDDSIRQRFDYDPERARALLGRNRHPPQRGGADGGRRRQPRRVQHPRRRREQRRGGHHETSSPTS